VHIAAPGGAQPPVPRHLAAFAAAVRAHAPERDHHAITWQLTFGLPRDKPAASVGRKSRDRLAQLIAWTNGEAELAVLSLTTHDPYQVHYDLTSADQITACLRDLTQRLTQS
jgi:hypothetical protein